MGVAIRIENLSKQYRLGLVSTRTLSHDLNRWWQTSILGREDPYLKIGQENKLSTQDSEEYVWALKDINFEVHEGEVIGIIGKNGAGKSTLLKILSRVTSPTTGIIKARGRIASLLEVGTGFHPEMTGRENIYMNGAIMGMVKAEIRQKFEEIVEFSGIGRYIDTPVKRYSSGMTVRLGFAVAAHLEPEILIVDEVLAVGDAEFQKKAVGKMQEVSKNKGRTVLFVSHNLNAVKNLCETGILLSNGKIQFSGEINETVDFYTLESKRLLKRKVIISEINRLSFQPRDIEIILVELLNSTEIASNEPIVISINLKVNNVKRDNARIIGMLNSMFNERVGLFFSENFRIPSNKFFNVKITLRNHNLAKGQYYFDFNIGTGTPSTAIANYDIVYNTVSFEVLFDDLLTKTPIIKWATNWGYNNYKDVNLKIQI
jgi:lipopolysaccharide transport system ATP-binding protein